MARGRFISESVATDMRLNSLSIEAELVYLMTIPHLDRDGRIEGDPDVLWGKVCPKRRLFLDQMATFIQEWIDAELVLNYDTDEGAVLWFKGFAKNQIGLRYERETPSRFPPPTSDNDLQQSGNRPAELRQPSGNSPAQWQVEVQVEDQVQVKDQGGEAAPPPPHTPPLEPAVVQSPEKPPLQDHPPAPHQEMFAAVCEAIGWDYHVITDRNKAQVTQTVKVLTQNAYTVADIRNFMVEVWFHDWRWEKKHSYPTLAQLREEIGKIRSVVPRASPAKQSKSMNSFDRLAANIGVTK